MSILVLKKQFRAFSGVKTIGSFSLKEVFRIIGIPVILLKEFMSL
jgi:hypothetical protein